MNAVPIAGRLLELRCATRNRAQEPNSPRAIELFANVHWFQGDWVEINGVGGEVSQIGLLRTVLPETGNRNDAGHPTGRKVAFVNSFAIEGSLLQLHHRWPMAVGRT